MPLQAASQLGNMSRPFGCGERSVRRLRIEVGHGPVPLAAGLTRIGHCSLRVHDLSFSRSKEGQE
jgi:hypothetical protein